MNDQVTNPENAIGGYDAVAYFEAGTPTAGSPTHAVEYDGRTWLFASATNAKAFENAPNKYAPAYAGQCAFATSLGKTETGDPTKWAIRSGRLFLNSNAVAHALWKVIPGRIRAADEHWKGRSSTT